VKCAQGYYLSQINNSCEIVDPDCADFDFRSLQCRSCYAGYSLIDRKCVVNKVDEDKKIVNCAKYDGDGKCIECFDRFYIDQLRNGGRGECYDVSFFCKGYDKKNGACTTCYSGFRLQGKECLPQ
jgi:hypothetical protein